MKGTPRWLIAITVSLTGLTAVGEEKPSVSNKPLQGIVTHGRALAMYEIGQGGLSGSETFNLRHAPLAGGPARDGPRAIFGDPPRLWHVAHGYLWASYNGDPFLGNSGVRDVLLRFRVGAFLEDKWVTTPEIDENSIDYGFFIGSYPQMEYTRSWNLGAGADGRLNVAAVYDVLPTSENSVLLFYLCNLAGDDCDGKFGTPDKDDRKDPSWSMAMFTYKNKWDAKAGNWGKGKWERAGLIEGSAHEQFHVLGKGDDYYFVTDSGKLTRAPKPDKGKDRKMEAVWDDKKRPIVAFITDADADRTFLFCKPDKDGKGVYFEMSDKPDLRPYDASKVPEAKTADQLPAVLAYAKILVADKKIKAKE
jgi:hypothetical protein